MKFLRSLFVISFLVFSLAAGVTFAWRLTKHFRPIEIPEEIDLPEVIIPSDDSSGADQLEPPEVTPSAKLRVISATLVGLFEEQKLKGVRILGEVKNTGDQVAVEPTPVLRLFDAEGKFIGSKRGAWTVPGSFRPLPSGGETFYDTYLNISPQSFNSVEISFNVQSVAENPQPRLEALKIKDRKMEQKEAEIHQASPASEVPPKLKYFQLSLTLVNTGEKSITDLAIAAWVKDAENKIVAAEYATYPQDILTAEKEIPLLLNLIPFREGEMADYRVEVFGRVLD